MTDEVKILGDAIVRTHEGQMMFSLGETGKIINLSVNHVAAKLHEAGIIIKTSGRSKWVNAYQIAEYMCKHRVAPIDNTMWTSKRPPSASTLRRP